MWPWIGLYLEESELYTWSRRTACLRPVADVAAVLAAHRRSNYRLVVNQSREQILPETLPAMSRGMRAQFLDSRLRRLFPDTPWRSVAPAAKPAASTPRAISYSTKTEKALFSTPSQAPGSPLFSPL